MLMQRRLRLASRIANELESALRNDDLAAARVELGALRKRLVEAAQQLAALTERLDPGVRLPKQIAILQSDSQATFTGQRRRFVPSDDLP